MGVRSVAVSSMSIPRASPATERVDALSRVLRTIHLRQYLQGRGQADGIAVVQVSDLKRAPWLGP